MITAKLELLKDKIIFKVKKTEQDYYKGIKLNDLNNYKTKYRIYLAAETEETLDVLIKEQKRKIVKLFYKDLKLKQVREKYIMEVKVCCLIRTLTL